MIDYQGKKITLIGEVKTVSPSGFSSRYTWEELLDLANTSTYIDIISIHTNPRWGGSFDALRKARALTEKPLLAKGYHQTNEEVRKAFNCGADYALVVGRIPDFFLGDFCFYEPLNLEQLRHIQDSPGHHRIQRVVWNARDLSDSSVEQYKTEKIEDARTSWSKMLIQASGISSLTDIKSEADGILVGSYLPEFLKNYLEQLVSYENS